MFFKSKTLVNTLNEVTVTIMSKDVNLNYHETFLLDTTKHHSFLYKGVEYKIPPEATYHYPPSFWAWGTKLAIFFEQHKLLASIFDVFGLRKRACYEIGYLYWENEPEPITVTQPEYDWALENYDLQHNTTIEGACRDADVRLKGKVDHTNWIMLIGIVIIVIVALVVLSNVLGGGGGSAPVGVPSPSPTSSPLPVITPPPPTPIPMK